MTRTLKNQPGDWVAWRNALGQERPAKVIAADPDFITIEVRGVGRLTTDSPLPRIRWQRQNGRARWSHA